MNTECAICFELVRFTDTQTPIATRCGHIFHDNCINQYLGDVSDDSLRVCPQCNQFTKQSELIQLFRTAPGVFIRKQKLVIEQYRRNLRAMKENSRLQKELIKTLRSTIKIQNLQKGRPLVNTNPHTGTEEIEQQLRSLNLPNSFRKVEPQNTESGFESVDYSSMPQHSSPMEPHTFIRKLVEAAYPPVKAFRSKNRRKDEAHRGNVRSSTVVSDKNLQDEKPKVFTFGSTYPSQSHNTFDFPPGLFNFGQIKSDEVDSRKELLVESANPLNVSPTSSISFPISPIPPTPSSMPPTPSPTPRYRRTRSPKQMVFSNDVENLKVTQKTSASSNIPETAKIRNSTRKFNKSSLGATIVEATAQNSRQKYYSHGKPTSFEYYNRSPSHVMESFSDPCDSNASINSSISSKLGQQS